MAWSLASLTYNLKCPVDAPPKAPLAMPVIRLKPRSLYLGEGRVLISTYNSTSADSPAKAPFSINVIRQYDNNL